MKAGGYDFQCLGPVGPQTRESAFDFLQNKLGQSNTADYKGFHLERSQYQPPNAVSDVIIVKEQKPESDTQPVVFSAIRTTWYRGIVGYNFSVSRSANPTARDDVWSPIDLYPGACEQGVKALVANNNPKFRQMDSIELGAYAYLFGTGLQTLDHDPAIDYKDLIDYASDLSRRITEQIRFGRPGLFFRPGETSTVDTLDELIDTLITLKRSAAVPPETRKKINQMILTMAYLVGGESHEKAEELAKNDSDAVSMFELLRAAVGKK